MYEREREKERAIIVYYVHGLCYVMLRLLCGLSYVIIMLWDILCSPNFTRQVTIIRKKRHFSVPDHSECLSTFLNFH